MWNEKKPFLYKTRMYLFGQKYTQKEQCINWMAFMMWGTCSGIAIPVIIENIMGVTLDTKAEKFTDILPLVFYFSLYIIIFYPIFYYISKFIVEAFLFIVRMFSKRF